MVCFNKGTVWDMEFHNEKRLNIHKYVQPVKVKEEFNLFVHLASVDARIQHLLSTVQVLQCPVRSTFY
jgi:hypothetical protein